MIYPPAAEPYYRIDAVVAADPNELVREGLRHWPYGGNAQPSQTWFDVCRALGVDPEVMIWETYPTRSQSGYDHGVADCQGHEARARSVGHTGANMYVVSDGWSGDAWDCSWWASGVVAAATMPFFSYGSVAVCESFAAVARQSPLFIDVGNGAMIPETWGRGSIASQLVGPQANLSTPHDLDRVYVIFGDTPAPAPTPPPAPKELDVIYQVAAADPMPNAADGYTPVAGSYWRDSATRWLTSGGPGAGEVIEQIDPGVFLQVRQEKLDILAGAREHIIDVGAVVTAARAAITRGTKANRVLNEDAVEAAIRGVLA